MIRRETHDQWLLISQVEHARLAAAIAGVWGNDVVPPLPLADRIVRAVRLHDDGWYDWENAPTIDPATGKPRDFTEMPMAEATAIWTQSIAVAARGACSLAGSTAVFEERLAAEGKPLTPLRALVLESALAFPSRFTGDDWGKAIGDETWRAAKLDGTPELLREAGLLVFHGDRFEVTAAAGVEPLGGTWVSRHFARLAEQAVENRDDPDDMTAAEQFLAEQERQRETWRPAIDAYAGDDAERLIDGGYRLLRFFDWMSLWICCVERTEGTDLEAPGSPTIHFEPDGPGRFVVDPWPLAVDRLHVGVPGRAIPAVPLADDGGLWKALRNSTSRALRWTLVPAENRSNGHRNDA